MFSTHRQPHAGTSKNKPLWALWIPLQPRAHQVRAQTKSEARVRIKELLGLKRLPVGTVAVRANGLLRKAA